MDANQRISAGLRSASGVTERLMRLPAVATLDWCDNAAACVQEIVEPGYAAMVVAGVRSDGSLADHEASGSAGSASHAAQAEPGVRHTVGGLRAGADRLHHLGWTPGDAMFEVGVCGRLEQFAGAEWRSGPIGRLWSGVGVGGVVVGVYPLGMGRDGLGGVGGACRRSLVVMLGTVSSDPNRAEMIAPVLGAVLPVLAQRTLIALGDRSAGARKWLTSREQVVLEELTLGRSVREIAETLNRSPHTVHDHVKSLHRKLGASSRGELIARALGHLSQPVLLPSEPVCVGRAEMGMSSIAETKPAAVPMRATAIGNPIVG